SFGGTGQWFGGPYADPAINNHLREGTEDGRGTGAVKPGATFEVDIYDLYVDHKCAQKKYGTTSPACSDLKKCVKDAVAEGKKNPPPWGVPVFGGAGQNCRDRSEDLLGNCCLKEAGKNTTFTYTPDNYKAPPNAKW